jgi:hypothetical protein
LLEGIWHEDVGEAAAGMTTKRKSLRFLGAKHPRFVSDYPIQSIQNSLLAHGVRGTNNDGDLANFAGRAFRKLHLLLNVARLSPYAYFVPIMQLAEGRLFPHCYWAETIVYCFDCWPPQYDQWDAFFHRQRTRVAFISARQSAERMRQRVPGLDVIWMPEAIEPSTYAPDKPLAERSIDVLELGRRWATYHDKIRDHCAARGYVHKYEAARGQLVFATRKDFLGGLGDSKISVCFPSSLTHPERSGDVETMTLRYLESVACRCITVGRCPAEMKDLFGFNPVVEADLHDPAGQIDHILQNLPSFEPLLDRNLQRLWEVGTWDTRVGTMLELLRERGYE